MNCNSVARKKSIMSKASRSFLAITVVGLWLTFCFSETGCRGATIAAKANGAAGTETIVVLRHGEKSTEGLGQLNCMGLNRSLALPKLLIGRFGRAHAVFAPNPSKQVHEKHNDYSYVRPLETIEPTAIQLGLSVDTQIGFTKIEELQKLVTAPEYANSTVFIAWEHKYAYDFARQMLRSYGLDESQVAAWPTDDFETMYVFRITRATGSSTPVMTFSVQQEGLSGSLSSTCPAP